jgi:hypothetical protein
VGIEELENFNFNKKRNLQLMKTKTPKISSHNRQLISVLSISGIIIGLLLIVLSRFSTDLFLRDLEFGLGLALAPSGILGLIGDYLVFGRTMDSLNFSNLQLSKQVKALSISTEFLKQSSNLGLEMIYHGRDSALKDFVPLMKEQAQVKGRKGKIIIIGSSINGLLEMNLGVEEVISKAIENEDCELYILLTHPEYSHFRENQELRPPGAIEDEIFRSIRTLENLWLNSNNNKKPISQFLKLYKGTPTCFMIIAGDRMLINPYPYEKEAYKSFCLSVRKVDVGNEQEKERSIYQQYYRSHFEYPWKRNSLPYMRYLLEGPIPDSAWDKRKRYGDIFIVQDSGKFYLAIYLEGEKDSEVRGVPRCIPFAKKEKGIIQTLQIENKFSVRLLKVTSDTTAVDWNEIGLLELNDDRRTGKFSNMINGNLINENDMLGLFQKDNESPFLHMELAEREGLRNTPLPLFYCWLDDKPPMPPIKQNNITS